MGDLVPQGADLGVLGVLVLLAPLDGGLQARDLRPEPLGIGGDLVSGLLDAGDVVVLALDAGVGLVNLLLEVGLGVLQASCLVDDILNKTELPMG